MRLAAMSEMIMTRTSKAPVYRPRRTAGRADFSSARTDSTTAGAAGLGAGWGASIILLSANYSASSSLLTISGSVRFRQASGSRNALRTFIPGAIHRGNGVEVMAPGGDIHIWKCGRRAALERLDLAQVRNPVPMAAVRNWVEARQIPLGKWHT